MRLTLWGYHDEENSLGCTAALTAALGRAPRGLHIDARELEDFATRSITRWGRWLLEHTERVRSIELVGGSLAVRAAAQSVAALGHVPLRILSESEHARPPTRPSSRKMLALKGELASGGGIAIDSQDPEVVVVSWLGAPSRPQVLAYLSEMETLLRRAQPTALVFDLTNAGSPSLDHRALQLQWLLERREVLARWTAGVAFVVPSRVWRLLLGAVLPPAQTHFPYCLSASRTEALGWAREAVEKRRSSLAASAT